MWVYIERILLYDDSVNDRIFWKGNLVIYIKSFKKNHALWPSNFSLMSLPLEYNKDCVERFNYNSLHCSAACISEKLEKFKCQVMGE